MVKNPFKQTANFLIIIQERRIRCHKGHALPREENDPWNHARAYQPDQFDSRRQ